MNATVLIPLVALALPAGELSIDYTAERTFEVSIETEVVSETTHMRMEINGEEREGGRFGSGGPSEYRREVVYRETVLAHDDGAPTKVRRAFETVSAVRGAMRGEESMEFDVESPLEDVTLIIALDEGEAVASIEDGSDPERSEMLEGHRLENLLHGILPESDATEWEPEAGAIASMLLLDVERALFPPPQFDEGGGEHGGGRRFRGGFGGSGLGFLREAEWDARATRAERAEEIGGRTCIVIELELEAEGEMPEMRFGRGGRDRMAGTASVVERIVANTFEVELTGELFFDVEARMPVRLELEGEFMQGMVMERETERGEFRMERTVEGSIEHEITITAEDA